MLSRTTGRSPATETSRPVSRMYSSNVPGYPSSAARENCMNAAVCFSSRCGSTAAHAHTGVRHTRLLHVHTCSARPGSHTFGRSFEFLFISVPPFVDVLFVCPYMMAHVAGSATMLPVDGLSGGGALAARWCNARHETDISAPTGTLTKYRPSPAYAGRTLTTTARGGCGPAHCWSLEPQRHRKDPWDRIQVKSASYQQLSLARDT